MIEKQLQELVSLTQSYLFQEELKGKWFFCDEEAILFYGELNKQQKKKEQPQKKLQEVAPAPKIASIEKSVVKEASAPPPEKNVAVEPPPPAAPIKIEEKRTHFARQPLGEIPVADYSDIEQTLKKIMPNLPIKKVIPSDQSAIKKAQNWKKNSGPPEIIILAFDENEQQRLFLSNLTQAIKLLIAPAALYSAHEIEKKKGWPQLFAREKLKLIVCSDYGMYAMPSLMHHYRQSPSKKIHYLGGIKSLLLTDISFYLKEPNLKASLWKALTAMADHHDD